MIKNGTKMRNVALSLQIQFKAFQFECESLWKCMPSLTTACASLFSVKLTLLNHQILKNLQGYRNFKKKLLIELKKGLGHSTESYCAS